MMDTVREPVMTGRTVRKRSSTPSLTGGPRPGSGYVISTIVRLERGQYLYREGEQPATLYLLQAGVVRVLVPTVSGRSRLADLAGPGDVLATSALDSAPHAECALAADDVTVGVIDLDRTLASQQGRADLSAALVRQLTRSRELTDDLGLPMGARICRILARLAQRLGRETELSLSDASQRGGWRHLPFSLTHDDVALLAGCARVTATRILGELRSAGVLDGRRGDYALIPDALQEAADKYVYDVL